VYFLRGFPPTQNTHIFRRGWLPLHHRVLESRR